METCGGTLERQMPGAAAELVLGISYVLMFPLAELAGIILALRLANEDMDTDTDVQGRDVEIYTDN
jgi:hypothetical protein